MRKSFYCLLTGILLICGISAQAQEDYIIGERDILDISVLDEPEMSTVVAVSSQGTINFWRLGEIKAAGKSIYEIRRDLTETLAKDYLKDPVVEVRIVKFQSKEISIQGAVIKPGTYILDTNYISFIKLLSLAGGADESAGSRAYIIRGAANQINEESGEKDISQLENRVEVDLVKLLREGDLSEDKIIYGGDFVFVASRVIEDVNINYIWLEGEVQNPGQVFYQEGLTAFQACIRAGGLTGLAAPNRAKISRKTPDGKIEIIRVPLKGIRKGKKPDVPLKPGDRITVPQRIF
jgi:protein involved in polysaccharide export with SLBB domain